MAFSSDIFLFMFLPVTLAGYYLLRPRFRNIFLLAASFVFFIWMQPKVWWVLLLSIAVNYAAGMLIGHFSNKGDTLRRLIFVLGLAGNLLPLAYFKYFNFGISIINVITHRGIAARDIALPLGISFFTFSGISYLADIYHQKSEAAKNPLDAGLYIAFFPKLLQGPITRYGEIEPDLKERHVSTDDFVYGIERFIIGLAKKVIIADTLGATVDGIWNAGVGQNTVAIAWLGSVAYTLQIFFDFAGYSDMAVGLGRMFGFHLPENFNLPYISKSISEFWRRWHITLGSWFRDYVYIPLGGNRKGAFRTYLNLAIVFFLTGLWHGAGWNFIAWGIFNGFFMLIERFFRIHKIHAARIPARVKSVLLTLYALAVTNFAWVLFRAPDLHSAHWYIDTMFGRHLGSQPIYKVTWYLDRWTVLVLISAVLFSSRVPSLIYRKWSAKSGKAKTIIKYAVLLALMYLSILRVVSGTYNGFIYFKF